MRYLLDTHVLLWWLSEPEKLSKKSQAIIEDRQQAIFVSSVSFWEMAIKSSLGRLTLPHNLMKVVNDSGMEIISMTAEDGLGVADLPVLHQDPFDRMLIVQAKHRDMVFITHDKQIIKYPVVTLKA